MLQHLFVSGIKTKRVGEIFLVQNQKDREAIKEEEQIISTAAKE